jgi:hypothetical protein
VRGYCPSQPFSARIPDNSYNVWSTWQTWLEIRCIIFHLVFNLHFSSKVACSIRASITETRGRQLQFAARTFGHLSVGPKRVIITWVVFWIRDSLASVVVVNDIRSNARSPHLTASLLTWCSRFLSPYQAISFKSTTFTTFYAAI